ncbi:MAG: hypothetical protein AB1758_15315 [Candidatus Eremiobacterota bacterium]
MRTRAVSMLELAVAVAVFATAFLLLMGVFPTATRAVRQGEEVMAATFLAEQEIEQLRALDYADLVNQPPRNVTILSTNRGATQDSVYTLQTDVSLVSPGQPDLKRVRVLVTWTRERPRHLELTTYVANLP